MSTLALHEIAAQLIANRDELDGLIAELMAKRVRVVTAIEALRGDDGLSEPAPAEPVAPTPKPEKRTVLEPIERPAKKRRTVPAGPMKPCPYGCGFQHARPGSMALHVRAKHAEQVSREQAAKQLAASNRPVRPVVTLDDDSSWTARTVTQAAGGDQFAMSDPVAPTPVPMTPAEFTEALKAPRARYMPDGKVLACTEKGCGFEAGSIHDLIQHTSTQHHRQPLREERWPVLPADAPVPT